MDRRNFIRLGIAGTIAGSMTPTIVSADTNKLAGGLYYTKDAPGRWSKKIAGHLPTIEVSKAYVGAFLRITTPHPMNGYEHYIVKHIILDKNFNFIAEKMFNPLQDKTAESEFSIGKYRGLINVLSVCNQHDTWLNAAII